MCKIILKFGSALTHHEMSSHREQCEKGAGIMGWNEKDKSLFSYRDLTHSKMWQSYVKETTESPFWLFHSRMPSAGDVTMKNVQPFHGKETIGFCHNGTVKRKELMLPLAALGEFLDGTESDSYMLFRLLKHCHKRTVQTLLDDYEDNFVFVNVEDRQILVIGKFSLSVHHGHLLMAKNEWGEPKSTLICDFSGKIKFWQKRKPYVPTTYFSVPPKKKYITMDGHVQSKEEFNERVDEFLGDTPTPELESHYEHLEGFEEAEGNKGV